jgi:DNA polymerase I-like protein with 3'-5' exonuclease and polymerase domains
MPEDQILIQEALEGRIGPTWGLAKVMRGEIPPHPPVDQYPNPTYIELLSHDYPQGMPDLSGVEVVAIDTEGSAAHPWCLSFSVRPGEAYVIRPSQRVVMEAFAAWIESAKPTVVCHYLAHDLEVLAALGIHLDPSRCGDTMLIAYELGRMFSQSLKLGAYRELGMLMQDYNDLTRDADRDLAVEYLERVLREGRCDECRGRGIVVTSRRLKNGKLRRSAKKCDACDGDGTSWPVPQPLQVWQNGRLTTWQPSPVGKRVRRILDDVRAGKMNKDDEPTNPRDRWEGADPPEAIAAVTSALGPMPSATLDMVPREEAIAYAARDADATLRRWLLLDPLIDTWGLRDTYNTDLAIIPLVVEMQQTGMEVDTEYFAQLSREWRAEMSRIRHQLQKLVGYYVNPSSGKQVANLLFERLKLPPVKLTKSKASESTDDKVLEQLALRTKHPAVPLIQRHRKLHKLNGTYAHPLSLVDSADGRVRWEIKYTRTDTGRLSSSKPRKGRDKHNWIQGQNIPTRDEDDRKIKHGFVARKGCLLAEFDLSQIEWRITAHLSQDANLLTVFREGHDLHRMTAAKMNHIALDEVTSDQRYAAKRVGFGMGYQATWRAIQEQFALEGIYLTREEAQAFIDGFMAAYPGIPRFWEKVFAEARRNGYVRSTDGRIRWATAIRCTASWVREAAQREIGNMPVQSWAANIMKLVLLAAYKRVIVPMRRAGFDVRMLLTVHDSVLLEFPEGAEAMIDPLMKRVMRETVALSVPVSGDGRWGARWSDCKD